jgi:hypothetical protein
MFWKPPDCGPGMAKRAEKEAKLTLNVPDAFVSTPGTSSWLPTVCAVV